MEQLRAFWAVFLFRAGDRRYAHGNMFSRWRAVGAADLIAAAYVTDHSVGVFIRGPRGERPAATIARLGERRLDALGAALGVALGRDFLLAQRWATDTADPGRWEAMADWLHAAGDRVVYAAASAFADERTPA